MCTNVQEILCGKFLSTYLALSGGLYLIYPRKMKHTKKNYWFYESLTVQQLQPNDYKKCMKLLYDLYCPSIMMNSAEDVCSNARCKKICTIKALLKFYLRTTRRYSYQTDKTSAKDTIPDDHNIFDAPSLILDMKKCLQQTWKIKYE